MYTGSLMAGGSSAPRSSLAITIHRPASSRHVQGTRRTPHPGEERSSDATVTVGRHVTVTVTVLVTMVEMVLVAVMVLVSGAGERTQGRSGHDRQPRRSALIVT